MIDKRKTWFLDFDGTLVEQRSYKSDEDYILEDTLHFFKNVVKNEDFVVITTGREEEYRSRIESFMSKHGLKCDMIICGLPTGPRIVVNDIKPDGTKTAYSFNVKRDYGVKHDEIVSIGY